MIGRVDWQAQLKRRNVDIVGSCVARCPALGVFVALAGGVSAQEKKPEADNQDEIRALLTLTDEAATGKATNSLAIKWEQQHFIKSHGDKTYVPFTVSVDAAAFTAPTPVGLYLRVAKRGELPSAAPAAAKDADKNKKKGKKGETQGAGSQVDARPSTPLKTSFSSTSRRRWLGSRNCCGGRLPCRPATTMSTSR